MATGTKDQVAWNTSNDGMLAIDLNHDGKINDGTELFTPSFGGGHFATGSAALASLDGNHDGVIDHDDAAFDNLLIWKDANANGISDAGELSSLADNGVASISTTPTATVGEIDGQTVIGNGTFQMADGTTGNYIEVELDTSLGAAAQPPVASDGSKTFAIGSLEVADLIADFHDGAGGDKIDLSALLKGLAGVDRSRSRRLRGDRAVLGQCGERRGQGRYGWRRRQLPYGRRAGELYVPQRRRSRQNTLR